MAAAVSASPSAVASAIGHVTNFGVGYTAVKGDEALAGTTGTFCNSGSCFTNTDPAALFTSGKPFDTRWSDANNAGSNSYALAACTEIGGKWYIYESSTS